VIHEYIQIPNLYDCTEGDFRLRLTRFKEEHFRNNMALVDDIKSLAQKKGITPAQLCVAWVCTTGPTVIPLAGSSKASRTLENLKGGDVVFSEEELKEINEAIGKHKITGDRYFGGTDADMHLWN
jgi:pyridoxine 4-dehydrogenase